MISDDTEAEPDEQSTEAASGPPQTVIGKPWNLTTGMYCRAGHGGTLFTGR